MRTGRKLFLALLLGFLVLLGNNQSFGADTQMVSQDLYELQFLGVKLDKNAKPGNHVGLFLFIWKGLKPIKV